MNVSTRCLAMAVKLSIPIRLTEAPRLRRAGYTVGATAGASAANGRCRLQDLHDVMVSGALEALEIGHVHAPGAGERAVVAQFTEDAGDGYTARAGQVGEVLVSQCQRELDAARGVVGREPELPREAQEGAGDA